MTGYTLLHPVIHPTLPSADRGQCDCDCDCACVSELNNSRIVLSANQLIENDQCDCACNVCASNDEITPQPFVAVVSSPDLFYKDLGDNHLLACSRSTGSGITV